MARFLDPIFMSLVAQGVGLAWVTWMVDRSKRRWRVAVGAGWVGFMALWLCCSPWFSTWLVSLLQHGSPDLTAELKQTPESKRALVVLSAGWRNRFGEVPVAERLDGEAHGRLIGAARVYRTHGFGTVVVAGDSDTYTRGMADLLVDLGVPRERIRRETSSRDTEQNAANTALVLRDSKPDKVVLITSATHLPRAKAHFENAGLEVLAYPVAYQTDRSGRILPSSKAALQTHQAVHELLGFLET